MSLYSATFRDSHWPSDRFGDSWACWMRSLFFLAQFGEIREGVVACMY